MGKKSRLKKEQRMQETQMYEPAPVINELLDDYFTADDALAVAEDEAEEAGGDPSPVFFQGQLVIRETLLERLNEETIKRGIDEDEMSIAFTHRWNTPPD